MKEMTATQIREHMSIVELAKHHKAYRRAIQPYIDAKADVYKFCSFKMILNKDGEIISHEYNLTSEQESQVQIIDQIIENIEQTFRLPNHMLGKR